MMTGGGPPWRLLVLLLLLELALDLSVLSPVQAKHPTYPAGECVRCSARQLKAACPGDKCKAVSSCNALRYPAHGQRWWHQRGTLTDFAPKHTRCLPDARAKCSEPGMWGCSGCHNWVVQVGECGPEGRPAGGQQCEVRPGGYVLLRHAPNAGQWRRCVSARRWLVQPNIACTGIEDPDPDCTGPAGEVLWQQAWQEALRVGFPPQHPGKPPAWLLLMASPLWRSHQQMHVHIGRFIPPPSLTRPTPAPNMQGAPLSKQPGVDSSGGSGCFPLVEAFKQARLDTGWRGRAGCVSTDPHRPSVVTVMVNDTGGSWKARTPVSLISVFVPTSEGPAVGAVGVADGGGDGAVGAEKLHVAAAASDIAAKVRPFATARAAAAAVKHAAGVPYVQILTAHSQDASKCGSSSSSSSVNGGMDVSHTRAVPAWWRGLHGARLLRSATDTLPGFNKGAYRADAVWQQGFVVTAMLGGNQVWLMEEEGTDDCFDTCPQPPPPWWVASVPQAAV